MSRYRIFRYRPIPLYRPVNFADTDISAAKSAPIYWPIYRPISVDISVDISARQFYWYRLAPIWADMCLKSFPLWDLNLLWEHSEIEFRHLTFVKVTSFLCASILEFDTSFSWRSDEESKYSIFQHIYSILQFLVACRPVASRYGGFRIN